MEAHIVGGTSTPQVEDYLVGQWGEPDRLDWFELGDLSIHVWKWRAAANDQGVDMYVTLGASARPVAGRHPNHRVEYMIGMEPGIDEIAEPLAALGLYSHREGFAVGHGHTIPNGRPLWQGTDMRHFMVLEPNTPVIPAFVSDGLHTSFQQAIPIFEVEVVFNRQNGTEALLDLWKSHDTPFWSPARASDPGEV